MDAIVVNWQLIGFAVIQLIALVRGYHGLKDDNAKLRSDLALGLLGERSERLAMESTVKADLLTLITRIDKSVQEMAHRITTLESGQDEWTKALRARTHELANDMHQLALKVAILERIDRTEEPKS